MSTITPADKSPFWRAIEAIPPFEYNPDAPVVTLDGKQLFSRVEDFRNIVFNLCNGVDDYVKEFFDNRLISVGHVLDLGSGRGDNSRPVAKYAKVTAIDNSVELLRAFSAESVKEGCPKENIRLIKADIITMESYGKDFDVVLALDILSYVPPIHLQSTMAKIHRCMRDGATFIGTIFTKESGEEKCLKLRYLMTQLGAHFYDGGDKFVEELLIESGFQVKSIYILEGEDSCSFEAVK